MSLERSAFRLAGLSVLGAFRDSSLYRLLLFAAVIWWGSHSISFPLLSLQRNKPFSAFAYSPKFSRVRRNCVFDSAASHFFAELT
jgi:hypothetical protein